MEINRSTVSAICVGLSSFVVAQFPALPMDSVVDQPGRWQNHLSLSGAFDYNANTVFNELPLALLNGGYIDRDLRQRSSDALRDGSRNHAGYALEARLAWTGTDRLLGHRNWRPMLSVAMHEQIGLRFTKDLFDVTFFGNAQFEGQRADLAPTQYTQVRYQTAGVGIQFDRFGSYVRVDAVNGQSYTDVDATWAGLYTATDGRVLETSLLGKFYQSDTAGSALGRTNGIGAAISGRWSTYLARTTHPVHVTLEAHDLGFVAWNGNAVNITKDTLIRYEGFQITDILNLDDAFTGDVQLLDTFGLRYRTEGFTRLLPFTLRGSATIEFNARWKGTLMIDQRNLPGYIPQLTLSGTRRLGGHALLGASLSYGGFGGLRLGLATRLRIGQHIRINVATPHVPGFFMGKMRGAGLSAGVEFGF